MRNKRSILVMMFLLAITMVWAEPISESQARKIAADFMANRLMRSINDIELVNIESVRHLITFCLRTDSRLIHISTTSIAGLSVDGVPGPDVKLTEQDLWLGQNIDENKYVYSKYKAEELVLDAIVRQGLDAKIMRVGNLSARQKDGEFQINFNTNNFLALLRAR